MYLTHLLPGFCVVVYVNMPCTCVFICQPVFSLPYHLSLLLNDYYVSNTLLSTLYPLITYLKEAVCCQWLKITLLEFK